MGQISCFRRKTNKKTNCFFYFIFFIFYFLFFFQGFGFQIAGYILENSTSRCIVSKLTLCFSAVFVVSEGERGGQPANELEYYNI